MAQKEIEFDPKAMGDIEGVEIDHSDWAEATPVIVPKKETTK